jgi:RNA polymerase sigma-70 factor (family 1)
MQSPIGKCFDYMKKKNEYDTESELVSGFQLGAEGVLKIIFDTHYTSLWSFANRIVRDEEIANDLVANAIIKLWEKRSQMNSIKGIIAYLYTILRNECLQYINEFNRRIKVYEEVNYLNQQHADTETAEIRSRLIQLILLESQKMPAQMQVIFGKAYLDGKSANEIAAELNISTHTVQTQKKRAMKRLRQELLNKNLPEYCIILPLKAVLLFGILDF